jgi:hypothetical protein
MMRSARYRSHSTPKAHAPAATKPKRANALSFSPCLELYTLCPHRRYTACIHIRSGVSPSRPLGIRERYTNEARRHDVTMCRARARRAATIRYAHPSATNPPVRPPTLVPTFSPELEDALAARLKERLGRDPTDAEHADFRAALWAIAVALRAAREDHSAPQPTHAPPCPAPPSTSARAPSPTTASA